MRIACSTAAFKTDLETALAHVAALGFRHVDLIGVANWDHVNVPVLAADYDAESGRIRRALDRHGLEPIAMNFGVTKPAERSDEAVNEQRRAEIRAVCRLLRDLGIRVAAFYPGYWDGTKEWCPPREQVVPPTLETFREAVAIAREFDVRIGPEPHRFTPFETPAQALELLAAVPGLTIVLDVTHFLMQGLPVSAAEPLVPHAHHAHIRGANADAMQAPFEGNVDVPALLTTLRQGGYAGDLSIEYLPNFPGDVEAEIRALRTALEAAAGQRP